MLAPEPTLADLAAASGLQPRTIRSWVAQDLLPGPLSRGPAARYPADTLERLLAVRAMRELLGMPLAAIRQELLVTTPERVRAYAIKAAGLAPEPAAEAAPTAPAPDPASRAPAARSSALEYLRGLRAEAAAAAVPFAAGAEAPLAEMAAAAAPTPSGFEALERRLAAGGQAEPARKARAEEWLRIPVTPDVELAVRGRPDAEQRARLERCADLIRGILLGRNP